MDEISDRVRECEEEKLAELMKLIEYYGFNLNDGQTKAVLDFMVLDTMYWVLEPNPHYYDEKQIAEFIKFLRSCKGSALKISSTITNPTKGQVKGASLPFCFDNKENIRLVEMFMNLLLYEMNGDLHEYNWGIVKKNIKWGAFYKYCIDENMIHRYLIEPYTDEELDIIIASHKESRTKETKSVVLGEKCSKWGLRLCESSSFKGSKTKKYSFLYDTLVLAGAVNYIGDGFSGTIGREKYTAVKNWIRAYETQVERQDNTRRKELKGEKGQ